MEKLGLPPFDEHDTILSQLKKLAEANPNKPAYTFVNKDLEQRVITRQKLWDLTRKCAAVFKHLGLSKGDIVCNTLVNSPERLISYFGTLASGATPSQGQLFLADGSDLIRNLKESKSKAIIYDPKAPNGAHPILEALREKDETTGKVVYKDLPDLEHVIEIEANRVEEAKRWINIVDKEKEMYCDESIVTLDTAFIFVTSGTTGFSKLVPHNHWNALNGMPKFVAVGELPKNTCQDMRLFNMQSLGWVGGFITYYSSMGCSRTLVDLTHGLPENMTMGNFLVNIFNRNNINTALLMAHDIQHVLDASDKLDTPLDVLYTGGGPVSNATMNSLGKITHRVAIGYGGTEFAVASGLLVTKKSEFLDMCAGNVVSDMKARIVSDEETEVSTGKQGEIHLHFEGIFKGYLNNPSKTADAFTEDGWYRTGDIGYFDKEGKLFVLCRKADAINKDGFIHYPGWMEQRISKHPGLVKSVLIGIPDPVHHEEICLCYKPVADADLTTDDLREYCKKLFLTDENDKMTPLPAHYLIFDDFIINSNGKVDRKKMREEAIKRLNV